MAYMSQDNKKSKAPFIKAILNKYGLKGSLRVHNNSCLVLTLTEGKVDFIRSFNEFCKIFTRLAEGYIQVNKYHYKDHFNLAEAKILEELIEAMNVGNHDNSNIQSDYFDIGFYTNINIGCWDKPYRMLA